MEHGSQIDTAALVGRARSGDRDAFSALLGRYQEGVYTYILGRCGDPEKSQEVVQDAFITAYTTLDRLEKPASFRSWVIGIALNLLRRRRREVPSLELLHAESADGAHGADELADNERLTALRAALDELPGNYRTALTMHYFDRQRGREIGRELGVSEGAVHMILLRARKALAEKLKGFAPGADHKGRP